MKNRVISIIVLLLSTVAFVMKLNKTKIYYYNYRGNVFFKEHKYDEAIKNYEAVLKLEDNINIKNNIVKALYEEKKYKEVVEKESSEFFLRGNSYAFLGDNLIKENLEEAKKNYKLALEEYKKAMKYSDDINIKKNYEIVLKKIKDLEKNQQQNQDNQNKQNDQQENKNNNQQNQNSKDQNQNNQNSEQNQDQNKENNSNKNDNQQNSNEQNKQNSQDNKQNGSDNKEKKDDQDKSDDQKQQQNEQNDSQQQNQPNSQNNNEQQNKSNGTSTGDIKDSKEEIKKNEIGAILKRLEGNEKQSFKNNERVMNIETGNSNNKW